NRVGLTAHRCLPVYVHKQTFLESVGMSQRATSRLWEPDEADQRWTSRMPNRRVGSEPPRGRTRHEPQIGENAACSGIVKSYGSPSEIGLRSWRMQRKCNSGLGTMSEPERARSSTTRPTLRSNRFLRIAAVGARPLNWKYVRI